MRKGKCPQNVKVIISENLSLMSNHRKGKCLMRKGKCLQRVKVIISENLSLMSLLENNQFPIVHCEVLRVKGKVSNEGLSTSVEKQTHQASQLSRHSTVQLSVTHYSLLFSSQCTYTVTFMQLTIACCGSTLAPLCNSPQLTVAFCSSLQLYCVAQLTLLPGIGAQLNIFPE